MQMFFHFLFTLKSYKDLTILCMKFYYSLTAVCYLFRKLKSDIYITNSRDLTPTKISHPFLLTDLHDEIQMINLSKICTKF